jgi:hypothetical protein
MRARWNSVAGKAEPGEKAIASQVLSFPLDGWNEKRSAFSSWSNAGRELSALSP